MHASPLTCVWGAWENITIRQHSNGKLPSRFWSLRVSNLAHYSPSLNPTCPIRNQYSSKTKNLIISPPPFNYHTYTNEKYPINEAAKPLAYYVFIAHTKFFPKMAHACTGTVLQCTRQTHRHLSRNCFCGQKSTCMPNNLHTVSHDSTMLMW